MIGLKIRMFYKIDPEKVLYASFFIFYFIKLFFVGLGQLDGLLIASVVPVYFLFLVFKNVSLTRASILSFFSLIGFCALALFYIFFGGGQLVDLYFFISLPAFFIASSRLAKNGQILFVINTFLGFLIVQLLGVALQITHKIYGVGLVVPAAGAALGEDSYLLTMNPGSFVNSNDLSAVASLLIVFFVFSHRLAPIRSKIAIFIGLVIVFLTLSRVAFIWSLLVLLLFLLSNLNKKKVFVSLILVLPLFWFASLTFTNFENFEPVERSVERIGSVEGVLSNGLVSDRTTSGRMSSYLNYFQQLKDIGFGTGNLRDYREFVPSSVSGSELFSTAPHSFIVEISYWGGWPMLVLFLLSLTLVRPSSLSVFSVFLFSFFVLSFISSTFIGNFMFFLVLYSIFGFHVVGSQNSKLSRQQLGTSPV